MLQGPGAGTAYSTAFLTGADFSSGPAHAAAFAGCSDGFVRLFDFRAAHPRGPDLAFRTHDGPLTGLAVRGSGVLATASQSTVSELHFSDIRMAAAAPTQCAAAAAALIAVALLGGRTIASGHSDVDICCQ